MKTDDRTDMFQHLVLSALWIIILFLASRDFGAKDQARNWVGSARAFGDLYGIQGNDAKEYRREKTYQMFE